MYKIALFAAALALAGCQTAAEAPSTASGKPEVTIKSTVPVVKAQLLSLALNGRYSVTKDTEYLLQIEKPSDNIAAAILLGSKYDSTPAERIVFTFAPLGDSVRVVAASMIVTNPGSAFEQLTPINAGEGVNRTQATLLELKGNIEAANAPPPVANSKPAKHPGAATKLSPSGAT